MRNTNLAFGIATLEKPGPMRLRFLDSSLIPTEAKVGFPPHILPFLITCAAQNVPNQNFLVSVVNACPKRALYRTATTRRRSMGKNICDFYFNFHRRTSTCTGFSPQVSHHGLKYQNISKINFDKFVIYVF